jgi:hypothetical protein
MGRLWRRQSRFSSEKRRGFGCETWQREGALLASVNRKNEREVRGRENAGASERERGFRSGESEIHLGVLHRREIGGRNEGEKGRRS